MPREHRKRGRREEQKKKRQRDTDDEPTSKRLKKDHSELVDDDTHIADAHEANYDINHHDPSSSQATEAVTPASAPFYGLLDEDEHEYFRRADELLEVNQFEDADARKLFLESVWKEADGKELKIASSQSSSRLLERLILLSTPAQLKNLFQKFNGQYVLWPRLPIVFVLTIAASSTSSSTDSPHTAAKPSSCMLPP